MFRAVLQLCLSRSVTLSLVAALANDERNCKTRRTAVDVLCWNSWPSLPLCFARLFGSFCAVIRCDIIMIEDEELWLITCQTSCPGLLEANMTSQITRSSLWIYISVTWYFTMQIPSSTFMNIFNLRWNHFEEVFVIFDGEHFVFYYWFHCKSNNCKKLHFKTSPWVLSYSHKVWWINIETLLTKVLYNSLVSVLLW